MSLIERRWWLITSAIFIKDFFYVCKNTTRLLYVWIYKKISVTMFPLLSKNVARFDSYHQNVLSRLNRLRLDIWEWRKKFFCCRYEASKRERKRWKMFFIYTRKRWVQIILPHIFFRLIQKHKKADLSSCRQIFDYFFFLAFKGINFLVLLLI